MKKILSMFIAVLMLMQMFAFSVSSEDTERRVYWTGEGPGEVTFTTIEGFNEYRVRLYKNGEFMEEIGHSLGDYELAEVRFCFLDAMPLYGSGTYRAEVVYEDEICVSTDDYSYKKPLDALQKTENIVVDMTKNYISWDAVEGAVLYDLIFCFSDNGGRSFLPICSYQLDAQEDGAYFDFWGKPEEELAWIEESYQENMENSGATSEDFIKAVQIVSYPRELNDINPSYSDYMTFDGITIPDGGDMNARLEIVDYQEEVSFGDKFYAELRLVEIEDDGTETYQHIDIADCVIDGFDPNKQGWQNVIIWYGDIFAECDVYVNEREITENLSGSCGENVIWTLDENGVLTISGTGEMEDYSSAYDMPWCDHKEKINEIVIENGVTKIGDYAFYGLENLVNVTIADSVTKIGEFAFYECKNAVSIEIGASVAVIGESAFSWCESLESIAIHANIESIGYRAFYKCISLTNINVDDSNLNYCSVDGNLFNKNKTAIIQYAAGKTDTSYEIPDSVTEIGDAAFDGCENLTSITIGKNVASIGEYAFRGCSGLTIKIPASVKIIGNYAFAANQYLKSAELEDGVTEIGEYAFWACGSLESITIPASVTKIGDDAFWCCDSLKDIYYIGTEEDWDSLSVGNGNDAFLNATVHFEDISEPEPEPSWWEYDEENRELIINVNGDMGDYGFNTNQGYTEAPWGDLSLDVERITIGDSVTSISDGVFNNFRNLREVNIGANVKKIGVYAFFKCINLEEIKIPDSVTFIDTYAFAYCPLNKIEFGNGLTRISQCAFMGCEFTKIIFPDSLRIIGADAFTNCRNLKEIYFPSSVRNVVVSTFDMCEELSDVYYGGTQEEWMTLLENSNHDGNERFFNAIIHCTDDTEKTIRFDNVKTEYEYGEDFCAEVWIRAMDGEEYLAESWDSLEGFDSFVPGWQIVTIRYGNYSESFEVLVKEKENTEPTVTNVDFELAKTEYFPGEELVIRVYAHTSDGECNLVNDYEVEGFDPHYIGVQKITLRYGEFSQTFIVEVFDTPNNNDSPSSGGGGGGSIDRETPTVTVSSEKCRAGNTVDVTVSISNNTGFTNLGLEIIYDRALKLIGVTENSGVGATFTGAETLDVYPYNIGFDSTDDVTYNGELVTLTFEVPEDAQPGDYCVNVDFYKGRDGNYIDGESVNYDADDNPLDLCYEDGIVNVYNYIPGDINCDGAVTNKDGTALLRYLAGWTLEDIDVNALDTDGDGAVTNKDGTRLLRYLAGWDVEVH